MQLHKAPVPPVLFYSRSTDMELLVVSLASLLAGFVDSVVGGGGLILVPALFATFPGAPPATLFGTNKAASVWGTGMATVQYARRVNLAWHALLPAAAATLVASLAGAWLVTQISPEFLRKLLPLILLAVLLYTLVRKQLGREHAPRFQGPQECLVAVGIGSVIGFYDGFLVRAPGASLCSFLCG